MIFNVNYFNDAPFNYWCFTIKILKSKYILKTQCTSHTFNVWSLQNDSWIFFEWVFRRTKISFAFIVGFIREGLSCFVRNIQCKNRLVEGHLSLTLQLYRTVFFSRIQNLCVVWRYTRSHVFQTAITYFNRITVEYFEPGMSHWKIALWKKCFTHICFYVLEPYLFLEPYYFGFTLFFFDFILSLFFCWSIL